MSIRSEKLIEELDRLHGVINILEQQAVKEKKAYEDERARLLDELHRANTVLLKIRHHAADFEEVMEIIKSSVD